jgi:hypothetical protein
VQSGSLPDGALAWAYDPLTGKLASIVSPSGQTLSYKYDGPLTAHFGSQLCNDRVNNPMPERPASPGSGSTPAATTADRTVTTSTAT